MTEEKDLMVQDKGGILEKVIIEGDLSKLTPGERVVYYRRVCETLGLNPLTRPFEYIVLNDKLTLYARRECTDQLRQLHKISVSITARESLDDVYSVTAMATMPDGRTDASTGVVSILREGGEWKTAQSGKRYFVGNGQWLKIRGDDLANSYMKAECVPLNSEILTRDGFKKWDTLTIGEEVLAYNVKTDMTVWTPLLNVTHYPSMSMVRLYSEGRQFEVLCTPEHSWAVKGQPYKERSTGTRSSRGAYKNRKPDRRLLPASQLKTSHSIILSAPLTGTSDDETLLTPIEAALLGWAVTDGTIKRVGNSVRIGISQSKEENFIPIRELVGAAVGSFHETVSPPTERTFPSSGRTYQCKKQHWWYIPAAMSRMILERAGYHDRCDLPAIASRLSSMARKAMLQAFMLAEGDKRNVFANGDRHILDTFEMLCALEGLATGRRTPKDTVFTERLKTTRHVAVSMLNIETVEPGPVWCPTTAYGTWVMRQNGRVMITGNTKAKRRVTLSIVGLGWLDESEIETISDAQSVVVDTETGEIKATAALPAQVKTETVSKETIAPSIMRLRAAWAASGLKGKCSDWLKEKYGKTELTMAEQEAVIKRLSDHIEGTVVIEASPDDQGRGKAQDYKNLQSATPQKPTPIMWDTWNELCRKAGSLGIKYTALVLGATTHEQMTNAATMLGALVEAKESQAKEDDHIEV